jgi:hypothetical protein
VFRANSFKYVVGTPSTANIDFADSAIYFDVQVINGTEEALYAASNCPFVRLQRAAASKQR